MEQYNTWSYVGNPWIANASTYGMLDYAHLPLVVLKDLFPEDFEQLQVIESFALIRNPVDRFYSSIHEKIKHDWVRSGRHIPRGELLPSTVNNEITQVINYLSTMPETYHLLPQTHIHFQRQVDYIYLEHTKIIKNVFCLSETADFFSSIVEKTGLPIDSHSLKDGLPKLNSAKTYRNDFIAKVNHFTKPTRQLLKYVLPVRLKDYYTNFVYVKSSKTQNPEINTQVESFVKWYYKKDIELFTEVCNKETN